MYRPDIDGLRAVAVVAVVINHLAPTLLPGGYVGVDIFFVISGYLITSIILSEMATGGLNTKRFYERRVRRIIPALFVMLLAVVIAGYFVLLPSDYLSTLKALASTVFFGSNIFFWREAAEGYFAATDASLNPLLHTWSLGVEEQFYMAFPVFVLLAYRYARRQFKVLLLLAALCSLLLAEWLLGSMGKGVAVFFLTPFRAWELLAGSLLAAQMIPSIQSRYGRELLSLAGLTAIVWSLITYSDKTAFPGFSALLPVLGSAAIIYAGMSGGSKVASLLSLRPVVFVGLISYSLYLWHWPIIVLARYRWGLAADSVIVGLLLLLASFVAAWLSWHFIEGPFRRPTYKISVVYASVLAVSLVFVGIFSVGYFTSGFQGRVSQEVIVLDKARSPAIAYIECDGASIEKPCMLGSLEKKPATALLFGDSHMLAWGPALDGVYKARDEQAYFFTNSSCPPLFYLTASAHKKECVEILRGIKRFIEQRPEINTVVLAAYWSKYYSDPAWLLETANLKGAAATSEALALTLSFLRHRQIKVVLLGPVPTFEKNVPHDLAVSAMHGRDSQTSSKAQQYLRNADFFGVADVFKAKQGVTLLDPIDWMCKPQCKNHDGGISFYRDDDHLSVTGALRLQHNIIYP